MKMQVHFFLDRLYYVLLQLQLKVFEESSEDFYNATSCVNKNSKKEARSKKLPLVQQKKIIPNIQVCLHFLKSFNDNNFENLGQISIY